MIGEISKSKWVCVRGGVGGWVGVLHIYLYNLRAEGFYLR